LDPDVRIPAHHRIVFRHRPDPIDLPDVHQSGDGATLGVDEFLLDGDGVVDVTSVQPSATDRRAAAEAEAEAAAEQAEEAEELLEVDVRVDHAANLQHRPRHDFGLKKKILIKKRLFEKKEERKKEKRPNKFVRKFENS